MSFNFLIKEIGCLRLMQVVIAWCLLTPRQSYLDFAEIIKQSGNTHLISVPQPWRLSWHHSWRRNTFPPFPDCCPQGIPKLHSCPLFVVIVPSLLLSSFHSYSLHGPCRITFTMLENTIWVAFSSPWLGDHYTLELHTGFCCEPPRVSHYLCRKCLEVSYSISSQGIGSFFRVLLSRSSSHRHKGMRIR